MMETMKASDNEQGAPIPLEMHLETCGTMPCSLLLVAYAYFWHDAFLMKKWKKWKFIVKN